MQIRVLDGLPKLLSMGIGNVPGPVGFFNGVIQGLADSYVPTMSDEQLSITINYVLGELEFWLHGTVTPERTISGDTNKTEELTNAQ